MMENEDLSGPDSTRGLEALIAAAGRNPPEPAGARDRIMATIRREAASRRAGGPLGVLREWLVEPRPVRVTRLGGLAAAALVASLVVGAFALGRSGDPSAVPTTTGTPVQFVLVAPAASAVSLVGDFNDWRSDVTHLVRTGPSGIWSVDVPLPPGRHVYAFIVDDVWTPDALAPRAPDSEFGAGTSVVVVQGGRQS